VDELPADLRDGVLKVDDPLMQSVVSRGGRTIIAATNAATLEPSAQTLQKAAAASRKTVNFEMSLIPDAFDAFLRGDFATHDRLVIDGLTRLADRADTIVLAQASMARVVGRLPGMVRAKVLSSPELAIEALARLVKTQ
jgi:hypothetical protein